jgi:hypothetical protein
VWKICGFAGLEKTESLSMAAFLLSRGCLSTPSQRLTLARIFSLHRLHLFANCSKRAIAGAIVETIGQGLAISRELGTSRIGENIEALEINEQSCR